MAENNKYFSKVSWRRLVSCVNGQEDFWQSFFKSPAKFFSDHHVSYIKNKPNDPTTISIIEFEGKKYLAKRYNRKGFWHGLKIMFRGSNALSSWYAACLLYQDGTVSLAEPISMVEKRWGPFHRSAFVVTEFLSGALKASELRDIDMKATLEGIARLANQLQAARIQHNDFQLENILFVGWKPYLVDFDHIRFFSKNSVLFAQSNKKDLDRIQECFDGRDLLELQKLLGVRKNQE